MQKNKTKIIGEIKKMLAENINEYLMKVIFGFNGYHLAELKKKLWRLKMSF